MKEPRRILDAIANVLERSSIYSKAKGTVEVERLYLLPKGLEVFVQNVPRSCFEAEQEITQEDCFFDIGLDRAGHPAMTEPWQLADTDHCIRIRTVRNSSAVFLEGEIKVAYPGPQSNPNARFSPADKLTEGEVEVWNHHLRFLGFEIERTYRKRRVPFKGKRLYQDLHVELEADCWNDDSCNGEVLAGESFVTISVETEGSQLAIAERALCEAKKDIENAGIVLIECDGTYEDYFYGRKKLPSKESAV